MPQQHRFAQPSHAAKRTLKNGAMQARCMGRASTGFITVATAFGCSPSFVTRIPFVQAAALWVHTWAKPGHKKEAVTCKLSFLTVWKILVYRICCNEFLYPPHDFYWHTVSQHSRVPLPERYDSLLSSYTSTCQKFRMIPNIVV